MKKVSLSKFQTEIIRAIYIMELFRTGNIHDDIGGGINDKLLNYTLLSIYEFTDEETDYLKIRLNTISRSRIMELTRINKFPFKKIESTIRELKDIFN